MADDHVLNSDQSQEQNEADDIVAADDELAEGLDDASGRRWAFTAMKQNAAAGGQIEREAEER